MTKTCPHCEQALPLTSFYKSGLYWTKRCKKCHNIGARGYTKRLTGFAKLSEDTQHAIKIGLLARKTKKLISIENGINSNSLCRWVRAGQIPSFTGRDEVLMAIINK
jgi:hypothetical protein